MYNVMNTCDGLITVRVEQGTAGRARRRDRLGEPDDRLKQRMGSMRSGVIVVGDALERPVVVRALVLLAAARAGEASALLVLTHSRFRFCSAIARAFLRSNESKMRARGLEGSEVRRPPIAGELFSSASFLSLQQSWKEKEREKVMITEYLTNLSIFVLFWGNFSFNGRSVINLPIIRSVLLLI